MKLSRVLLIFLIITPIVALLQYNLLKAHLLYGFADVDWAGLLTYKYINNPLSIGSFLNAWNKFGVYATQYYYIGIQDYFFGLDYRQYNIVAFILKFLSTITVFPLFYIVTKRKLIAILGTFIYAFSFTSIAALYTVMTTINYLGVAFMNIFLWRYWRLIEKKTIDWRLTLSAVATFYLAFFFATERMYPLVLLMIIGEFFYICRHRFSKIYTALSLKRLLLLFAPSIFLMLIKPKISSEMIQFFLGNSLGIFQKISDGNWHLLFTPFAALGSMFLPKEYHLTLGVINLTSLTDYLKFLLGGPLFIFGIIILTLGFLLSKNPRKFILTTIIILISLAVSAFFLATHQQNINPALKLYFDPGFVIPNALIGMFIFSLTCAFFLEWIDRKMQNNLVLSLFMGPAAAFFFIFVTWLPADIVLVFMGIHRYLTIPTIGISLFLATALVLMYDQLRQIRILKSFSFAVFLLLLPMFLMYSQSITNYFDYELNFAGTKATEHIRMKGKLLSYIKNLSETEPSVFFFDESQDPTNSYFNETTVLAGFNFWIMFRENHILPIKFTPKLIRSYFLCGGNGKFCPAELKKTVAVKDGIRGLQINDTFYQPENFYAFRFINRDIYNVTDELKQTIELK